MFVWTSGFQNPLAHTHFNMFVDGVLTKALNLGQWNPKRGDPELKPGDHGPYGPVLTACRYYRMVYVLL